MDDALIKTVIPSFMLDDHQVDPKHLKSRLEDIKGASLKPLTWQSQYLKECLDEWKQYELWKHFQLSWDMFCEIELGKPSEWIDLFIKGAQDLDPNEIRQAIIKTQEKLIDELTKLADPTMTPNPEVITKPGNPKGTNQHTSKDSNCYNYNNSTNSSPSRGTDKKYLARKVAALANPSHPDHKPEYVEICQKMIAGDMTAFGAAKKMGFAKQAPMVRVTADPSKFAENLKSKCDAEYLNEMAESMGYIVPSVDDGGDIASKLYQSLNDQQLRDLYTNLCDYLSEEF